MEAYLKIIRRIKELMLDPSPIFFLRYPYPVRTGSWMGPPQGERASKPPSSRDAADKTGGGVSEDHQEDQGADAWPKPFPFFFGNPMLSGLGPGWARLRGERHPNHPHPETLLTTQVEAYLKIIRRIRELMPDAAITADVIVGYHT